MFLAAVTLVSVSLQRTYGKVPVSELKRRARSGNKLANTVLRAVGYGYSLRVVLTTLTVLSCSGFFVLVSISTTPLTAFVLSSILIYLGFVWLPASQITKHSERLVMFMTPGIAWVLDKIHPSVNRIVAFIHKHRPITVHTGMYVRGDLIDLLDKQSVQADSRIEKAELNVARHALSYGDKTVGQIMTPHRMIKAVSSSESVGPVLIDELHKSGHSRFPVYDGETSNIIGTLFMRDLAGKNVSGPVSKNMNQAVYYVHEDQSIDDALQAILKTHHQLFMVVNEFEELVGLVTIEDILETIIGKIIVDEFDQYDDLRAVAARAAAKEHKTRKEPIKPESKENTKVDIKDQKNEK